MADTRQTGREHSSTPGTSASGRTPGSSSQASSSGGAMTRSEQRDLDRGGRSSMRPLTPFESMRRIADEMDRTFDRLLEGWGAGGRPASRWQGASGSQLATWMPRIEAFEQGDTFIARAELPGLKKDDVQVNVTDEAIVIQGQRRDDHEEQREGFYHSERAYGSFYRAIPLPEGAIVDRAEATFKDGVLEVRVPSPPPEVRQGRNLEIKTS
jgi:HSP20 family protein